MYTPDEKMCKCGHKAEDHHRSYFPGGGELIDECEVYGGNETGGMQQIDGRWVDHCYKFDPVPIEIGPIGG